MTSKSGLTEAVHTVPLTDWDPIGIRDLPQAQNGHDEYAPATIELLRSGANAERIATDLLQTAVENMCLDPDPARAEPVTLKLLALAD
jgi:hypothetical protein